MNDKSHEIIQIVCHHLIKFFHKMLHNHQRCYVMLENGPWTGVRVIAVATWVNCNKVQDQVVRRFPDKRRMDTIWWWTTTGDEARSVGMALVGASCGHSSSDVIWVSPSTKYKTVNVTMFGNQSVFPLIQVNIQHEIGRFAGFFLIKKKKFYSDYYFMWFLFQF